MKRPRMITRVGVWLAALTMLLLPWAMLGNGLADTAAAPSLKIREIDISGDNFVVLQNVGGDLADLSTYWLGYLSDSSSGQLVPTQQLPAVPLATGQSIIVLYSGSTDTCDASFVAKLSFSFAKTGGTLALWQMQGTPSGVLTFTSVDRVKWANPSKTAALPSGVDIDIRKETTPVAITNPVWYSDPAQASHNWQVGDLEGCSLTLTQADAGGTTTPQTVTWQQADTSPPSIQLGAVITGGTKSGPTVPAADKGLLALELSELLPNTAKPQTDAANEFIELYNPNKKSFDLSGFMLQTASATSSTVHTWHFPAGTVIGPGSFKAFYSAQTHLTLNNSGGEVWLVDPLGTTVTHSAAYGKADDGMAWVNADGKWQWTATPTPGATNKVATPIASNGTSKTATVNNKKVTAVAGSTTGSGTVAGASTVAVKAPTSSIHPAVLAAVAGAALLYGAYEYRHDLAHRYRQFRRNRAAGR